MFSEKNHLLTGMIEKLSERTTQVSGSHSQIWIPWCRRVCPEELQVRGLKNHCTGNED